MQLSRLFEIVYLLLDKKSVTAKELAHRFEVSRRTIYRDIDVLSQAGIPIYTNRGRGGGICLVEHFILDKSILSKEEQNSILASLQGINAFSITDVNSVLSRLTAFFGVDNYDWIEVNFSSWDPQNPVNYCFEELKRAILNQLLLSFSYSSVSGDTTTRLVEPVKLIFKSNNWYLSAYCREKKDFRFFKISRMREIIVKEEHFKRKAIQISNKEQKEYNKKLNLQSVVVKVSHKMAFRVYDEFNKDEITRTNEGDFILSLKRTNEEWLYFYLMSYGAELEVIKPEWIREEIKERYKKAQSLYENKT